MAITTRRFDDMVNRIQGDPEYVITASVVTSVPAQRNQAIEELQEAAGQLARRGVNVSFTNHRLEDDVVDIPPVDDEERTAQVWQDQAGQWRTRAIAAEAQLKAIREVPVIDESVALNRIRTILSWDSEAVFGTPQTGVSTGSGQAFGVGVGGGGSGGHTAGTVDGVHREVGDGGPADPVDRVLGGWPPAEGGIVAQGGWCAPSSDQNPDDGVQPADTNGSPAKFGDSE